MQNKRKKKEIKLALTSSSSYGHLRNRCFFSFTNGSKLASERTSTGTGKFAPIGGCQEKVAKLSKQTKKQNLKRFSFSCKVTCPINALPDFVNTNCISSSTLELLIIMNILCYHWLTGHRKSPVKHPTIENLIPFSSQATLITLCVCAIKKFMGIQPHGDLPRNNYFFLLETFNFTQSFAKYFPPFIINVMLPFVFSRFFRTESCRKELTKASNEMKIQVSQFINNWHTGQKQGTGLSLLSTAADSNAEEVYRTLYRNIDMAHYGMHFSK